MRVRWKIFLYLFGFGFIAYFQARTIGVAGERMMPELGITQLQLSWIETAFLVGYAGMQFPGGLLGQRMGARLMFVLIGLVGFAATFATPLAPLVLSGAALLAALCALQFLLGCSQGPIFPVSAGVFETWFPAHQWPLAQGWQTMGLGLGAAATPPVISWIMVHYGWQHAILWTSPPVLLLVALWWIYARNTPREHAGVGAEELAELGNHVSEPPNNALTWKRVGDLLRDRSILALTVSYIAMNYVFYLLGNWCFLYLVQERHFNVLSSGWLASVPPLAAAAGAGAGGVLASVLCRRFGARTGLRAIPLLSLPAAGALLLLGTYAHSPWVAVASLAMCFAAVELTEGPYWAAIMHVGRGDTMAAAGVMNTGGNLGGIIATPIIGWLSGRHMWTETLLLGAACAVVSGLLWLAVEPGRHIGARNADGERGVA
jgi:ACS family glucarate transporter-like MFS transporter